MSSAPRVLFLDIETAPNLSYVWGRWEQNVIEVHTSWYILSFAYKWQGQKRVYVHGLCDYPGYAKDRENDKELVQALWELLDDADIVIAHNADAFDVRKSTARILYHQLPPPSPFKTIDTLKLARKHFKLDSNRLDDLGAYLKVGRKIHHTGKNLWLGCMAGKPSAWNVMKRYNAHDVKLLELVYDKLKPWASGHPDLRIYRTDRKDGTCPVCQGHDVMKWGFYYGVKVKYQKWHCRTCCHWFKGVSIR